jgi:hypothetical protein
MFETLVTRAKGTRLAALLVAVALCAGVGGLTATTASASATVAPSAPSNIFAVSYGGADVTVFWDPTSAGGGTDDADSFSVTLDDGVAAEHRSTSVLADNPDGDMAILASVYPGTYDVTVTAVNTVGSAASAPISFVMTYDGVPGAPLNVAAHNAGDGIVQITWDAPTSEGDSPIEEYQVSIQFPDSVDPSYGGPYGLWNGQPIDASGREYTFQHVPFDHGDFIVTVNAVNGSRYPGYTSSTDPAPLVRSTVSSAPTQLSAVSTAANTVTVTWDAPSTDGGFPVTDYVVTMDPTFGTYTAAGDRTATFTDVPAGTHTVSVTADNVNGQSVEATAQVTVLDPAVVTPPVVTPAVVTPPVVTAPVVTPPAAPIAKAPSAPRHVAVATRTGGKAVVTFTAPRYLHHSAITSYIVKLAGQRKHVDATTRTVTFTGLTKRINRARVYARNDAGRSVAKTEKFILSPAKAAAKPITLELGMLGWTIRQLRLELMPNRASTGEFDSATRSAVLRWQANHHEVPTGVVNASMRSALGI